MGKHSKVSSTNELRLGENVVLRSMECLTPTAKFDIFITISHQFVCRPTLELAIFKQQVCSTMQMDYHWEQTAAKKGTWQFWIAHTKQNSSLNLAVNNIRFTNLPLNLVNLTDFLGVGRKLKKSVFKNNNQINFTVTTRT